jgi:hypothetical protein
VFNPWGRMQVEGVKNKVPRRIFGSEREELRGKRRESHDDKLHNL